MGMQSRNEDSDGVRVGNVDLQRRWMLIGGCYIGHMDAGGRITCTVPDLGIGRCSAGAAACPPRYAMHKFCWSSPTVGELEQFSVP